jgi:hypothetical protein
VKQGIGRDMYVVNTGLVVQGSAQAGEYIAGVLGASAHRMQG